jgi:hypothetical protein
MMSARSLVQSAGMRTGSCRNEDRLRTLMSQPLLLDLSCRPPCCRRCPSDGGRRTSATERKRSTAAKRAQCRRYARQEISASIRLDRAERLLLLRAFGMLASADMHNKGSWRFRRWVRLTGSSLAAGSI